MCHCFFGKLAVGFVGVGDESYAAGGKYTDTVDLAPIERIKKKIFYKLKVLPFCKVPCYHLFNIIGNMNPSAIKCSILPHEASHTTHVVPVI